MKRLLSLISLCSLLLVGIVAAQDTTQTQAEPVINRATAPSPAMLELETVLSGLDRPLQATNAGDGSGRLFIVEQRGRILVWDGSELTTFLDVSNLSSRIMGYSERGLLGLAFHPDYAENGEFFINYTDRNGTTVVARYTVSDNPNVADPNSAEILLTQQQPFANHNGGHLAFGPDGMLYIAMGDGGSAGDPVGAGQNPNTWLGSILRIDVNAESGYVVPEDNPFAGTGLDSEEVWAYGLRNPWRFSFDRATGDLYIGDVGQNVYEELNFEPADSRGGLNYGWNVYEANERYARGNREINAVFPFATYRHQNGNCSVTGGYVYRGDAIPDLQGTYLYGDYCTGNVWAAYRDMTGNWNDTLFLRTGYQVSSFGEDEAGEMYIVDYRGSVNKIVPAS